MTENLVELSGNGLFQVRVHQTIQAAQQAVRKVGLLIVDFERTDDVSLSGGSLGVEFLESVWLRLRSVLRDSDAIFRLDGGETVVLLPSVTGPEDVVVVAKKILNKLEQPFLLDGFRADIRPRIGIALFPEHSTSANSLIQRAHTALNGAKRTRSSYIIYSQEHGHNHHTPLQMRDLRQAIVEEQLFLLYQPKVSLKTGSISGLEVLARWRHPRFGLIEPDQFIPVAERTGLIIPLTLWVLHNALLQCRAWNKMGIDVNVAVNLSMWNLDALELPEQIAGLLRSVDMAPGRLELEITESAIMDDPKRAMRTLTLIRDLGVQFTIDDFGTGYSSLAHLKKLPVAGMKIDKSFVQNMELDRDNAVIVRSIIDLGHNLGLKVVAEGVETREAKEMLTEFACDEAQGYYFSPPVSAQAIIRFFNDPTQRVSNHRSRRENISRVNSPRRNGKIVDAKLPLEP
ncbi:MAG TPA: phosphodiesterase [Candidatus Binatia bacterium]|nr:phosphodiesterase [Candidatus Binatia bacterium]